MKNYTTERKNVNYVIINSIQVGELEYVLGKHETAEKYVTWQYYNGTYYYGHKTVILLLTITPFSFLAQ